MRIQQGFWLHRQSRPRLLIRTSASPLVAQSHPLGWLRGHTYPALTALTSGPTIVFSCSQCILLLSPVVSCISRAKEVHLLAMSGVTHPGIARALFRRPSSVVFLLSTLPGLGHPRIGFYFSAHSVLRFTSSAPIADFSLASAWDVCDYNAIRASPHEYTPC